MKKKFLIVIIALVVCSGVFAQTKETLSVMDFSSNVLDQDELILITDQISSYIIETNKYIVVERNKREQILSEINFSYSGVVDEDKAIEIGRLLASNYIVVGNIGSIGESRYWINIKLIFVETGESIRSVSQEYKSLGNLLDDLKKLLYVFIEPSKNKNDEYLIITPDAYDKFDMIAIGYAFYNQSYNNISNFSANSIQIVFLGNRGRKIGLFYDFCIFFPFYSKFDETPLINENYVFNWGVNGSVGVSTIFDLTKDLNILTGLGVHTNQHQYWSTDAGPNPIIINLGIAIPFTIMYRFNNTNLVGLAGSFYYDFLPLPVSSFEKPGDALGFSLNFMLGNAK